MPQLLLSPEIANTNERPDIVLWSISTRSVILIELTCPAEENFNDAKERKLAKYAALCEQIRINDWKVVLRTVEAGARGFVAKSFFRVFRELGFSSSKARQSCKDISFVTASCSYGMWLMRNNKGWNASRGLVVPRGYLTPPPTSTPAPLLANLPKDVPKEIREWHSRLGQKAGPK